jgi:hypothetical protein
MSGLKIYYVGEMQGVVSFDEDSKQMSFSTEKVKNIVMSLRQSNFSLTSTDEEIYDELPLVLRGQYYCEGDD